MSDNKNPQAGQQFQLELKPEVASGVYSNLALISHSHSDFILDFARILPGMPKPEVCSRVILAPEHAKRLLAALQENVALSLLSEAVRLKDITSYPMADETLSSC